MCITESGQEREGIAEKAEMAGYKLQETGRLDEIEKLCSKRSWTLQGEEYNAVIWEQLLESESSDVES